MFDRLNRIQKRTLIGCLFLATALPGCSKNSPQAALPQAPDYSQAEAWFEAGNPAEPRPYDIFYIVPTCVFDWEIAAGDTCHYMDVYNRDHRQSVDPSIRLAQGIFADSCNFFSPYYRQITLESWMEPETVIEERFDLAFADVRAAFDYFMKHRNQGRPFILAGHSQGGKSVIELLKREITGEMYDRLIAAYALGYPIRENDLCQYLVPAQDSIDTGVAVTYSSVSSVDAIAPVLDGTVAAINPLNWQTDNTYAPHSEHLGFVRTDAQGTITWESSRMLGAYIDTGTRALIVDGVNPEDYYVPSLSALFEKGNYHVFEMNFFYRNLQQNVSARIRAYRNKKPE